MPYVKRMLKCESCKEDYLGEPGTRYCSSKCMGVGKMGAAHPRWKGGRHTNSRTGYVFLSINGKYVMEHRHVMSEHLGRPLLRTEQVHHKDGNKSNNNISNLELCSSAVEHRQKHSKLFYDGINKECSRCNIVKPISEFHKRSEKPQGVQSVCKVCTSELGKNRTQTPNTSKKRLSSEDFQFIRDCCDSGMYSGVKLALMFGVTRRQIWRIKTGRATPND